MRVLTMVAVALFSGCLQTPSVPDLQPFPPSQPDPGQPASCPAARILAGASVDVTATLAGARPDRASCSDGADGPFADFTWTAPASGQYRITVTAPIAVTLDVRGGSCTAGELACRTGDTLAIVERAFPAGEGVTLQVAADTAGTIDLRIEQLPDACGDNLCEASESTATCPADCPATVCGDGVCEVDEDASSCAIDCAEATSCGNGICEIGEDTSCPIDCPTSSDTCGDGICDAGEDASCPSDCASSSPTCGDGICDIGEDASCPSDCGSVDTGSDDGDDCDDCFVRRHHEGNHVTAPTHATTK